MRKFAFATRLGVSKRTHNDSFILIPNLQQKSALHFFAVCEGHGVNGSQAQNFVKIKMTEYMQDCDLEVDPYKELTLAYQTTHLQMLKSSDYKLSGTTCCSLLLNGRHLIIANAGNSRALVVSDNAMSRQLTIDLTIVDLEERKRIV